MEEEKARGPPAAYRSLSASTRSRAARRRLVLGHLLGIGVGEVGQAARSERCVGVGEVVDLQPLAADVSALSRPDQHARHDDERGAVCGNAVLEVQLGQDPGRQEQGQDVIDQPDRQLARRQQSDQYRQRSQIHPPAPPPAAAQSTPSKMARRRAIDPKKTARGCARTWSRSRSPSSGWNPKAVRSAALPRSIR